MIKNDDREKLKKILDFLGLKLVNRCNLPFEIKHYELVLSDETSLYYMPASGSNIMGMTYWEYEPSVSSLVNFLCNEAYGLYIGIISKKYTASCFECTKNPFYGCKSLDEMLITIDMDNGEFAQ